MSEDKIRNVRAWNAARVSSLSGAETTVAICDELLALRALVLASRPALEAGAGALDDVGHVSWCGVYTSTSGDCDCGYFERRDHAAQLRTLSAYGVGK